MSSCFIDYCSSFLHKYIRSIINYPIFIRKNLQKLETATFKNIATELLDVDYTKRTVVAYVSKFGNIDLDGDMMMPGCYKKSIQERGKSGTNSLFHLSSHRAMPEFVLSKANFEEDSFGLKMESTLRETTHANDILEGYEKGIWNEHSAMFMPVKSGYAMKTNSQGQEYTEFREVKLFEGSTVVWGANDQTPTVELKSYFDREFEGSTKKAFDQLTKLCKAFRDGKFTDEMFSLIEIKIKLIESFIQDQQQKSIEPSENTQPQASQGSDLINWFINS